MKLYNVYKNGKLFLKDKSSTEISELIGIPVNKVSVYRNYDISFKGTYTFELARDNLKDVNKIPMYLWNEWDKICGMFRTFLRGSV